MNQSETKRGGPLYSITWLILMDTSATCCSTSPLNSIPLSPKLSMNLGSVISFLIPSFQTLTSILVTTSPNLRPDLLHLPMHWPHARTNAHQNPYLLRSLPKLKEAIILTDWGNLGAENVKNQEAIFTAVFEEVKADCKIRQMCAS